jgi:L-ascorbate metabolism protein UlaG (beta-lactamase superfamily)
VKITKHIHACLELEKSGARLLVDPGSYTEDMSRVEGVVAVVITHSHDDHCDESQLAGILANNPGLKIFGTAEVAKRLSGFEVTTVMHGDYHQVGPYSLEFFGDMHQEIHHSIPLIQNTAVMIDDTLYYPGDSYTRPDRPVKLLACPTSAPWLKIADVMDFISELKPQNCFPTHNVHLSEIGNELNNSRVKATVEAAGGSFRYLKVGESLEI